MPVGAVKLSSFSVISIFIAPIFLLVLQRLDIPRTCNVHVTDSISSLALRLSTEQQKQRTWRKCGDFYRFYPGRLLGCPIPCCSSQRRRRSISISLQLPGVETAAPNFAGPPLHPFRLPYVT